jgi:hypothetical protein
MTDARLAEHYEGTDELHTGLLELIAHAQTGIKAFLPTLDPRLWNREDLCDVLRAALLRHDRFSASLCVVDPAGLRRDNPRLFALVDRLPSRISVRAADRRHADKPEHFVMTDDHDYLRRPTPARDRWASHSVLPNEAPRLGALFAEIWERASSHPDLRPMHL